MAALEWWVPPSVLTGSARPGLPARQAARERSVPVPALLGMARQMRENVTAGALRAEGTDLVLAWC